MPNYSGIWTVRQQMQAQGASNWPEQPVLPGQQAYTTAGTYSWVAPATVKAVSVVAVGGGGSSRGFAGAGGGGGALAYKNNITVVPGNSYTVVVGVGSNINGAGGRVCGVEHHHLIVCLALAVANQTFVIMDGVVAFAAELMMVVAMVVTEELLVIQVVVVLVDILAMAVMAHLLA